MDNPITRRLRVLQELYLALADEPNPIETPEPTRRIIEFSDDTALEAAYLNQKLQSQGIELPPVDLLNLATAHAAGGTFVTHNKHDFDRPPLLSLVDVDIVHTSG